MMDTLSVWIGLAGTVAFAITAVLAVSSKGIDLFGAVVMGLITAIGGGTVRDVILNQPVFWAADVMYIWVAIGASLAAFWVQPFFTRKEIYTTMLYVDGLGVALFAIQATHKVFELQFAPPIGPILLGIVTAIGGGLVRDVLAGRQTLLMQSELYAVPVLIGCTAYVVVLDYLPSKSFLGSLACGLFIFGLRAAAIRWNLKMPEWLTTKPRTT